MIQATKTPGNSRCQAALSACDVRQLVAAPERLTLVEVYRVGGHASYPVVGLALTLDEICPCIVEDGLLVTVDLHRMRGRRSSMAALVLCTWPASEDASRLAAVATELREAMSAEGGL